jgi:hypothetical protein
MTRYSWEWFTVAAYTAHSYIRSTFVKKLCSVLAQLWHCINLIYTKRTVVPTRYRNRHFFNNFTRVATIRRTTDTHTTDTFLFISHTTNVLLFKILCNIFIGVRIIKQMPSSVASGTLCINTLWETISWPLIAIYKHSFTKYNEAMRHDTMRVFVCVI